VALVWKEKKTSEEESWSDLSEEFSVEISIGGQLGEGDIKSKLRGVGGRP